MLIEIKNWITDKVIFSYDCEDNTIKKTVEEAVQRGVNLEYADLKYTDLSGADLREANLSNADLSHADLSHADLCSANLSYADLSYANLNVADLVQADLRFAHLIYATLNYADLSDADLSHTNLWTAILRHANLRHAKLMCAYVGYANLADVDLSEANLNDADISHANLNDAIIHHTKINYPMNIPEGEFIGWKKIYRKKPNDYVIAKLKILVDSKRNRATADKCRCDKALVLGFETLEGEPLDIKEVTNYSYTKCVYKAGEIVYPDKWDDNRWNECSHGIHFFLDRQSAVEY